MRSFKIPTSPYCEYKVYKKSNIEIDSGVTVLVGCNGSGKTTLLKHIKEQLEHNSIPVISFNNLHDGGRSSISEMMFNDDIGMASILMCSSEGESIVINIENLARKIGRFISTGGKSKGNRLADNLDNAIANLIRDKENDKMSSTPTEYWILLDAIDSGLSIDNVLEIKEGLFNTIIEHCNSLGYTVYIVVSANEYEMCVGQKCFNVQTGKYININSYDDFKNVILDTRKYKDEQKAKYFASLGE